MSEILSGGNPLTRRHRLKARKEEPENQPNKEEEEKENAKSKTKDNARKAREARRYLQRRTGD